MAHEREVGHATALDLGDELDAFVAYDERLAEAARELGLAVEAPGLAVEAPGPPA